MSFGNGDRRPRDSRRDLILNDKVAQEGSGGFVTAVAAPRRMTASGWRGRTPEVNERLNEGASAVRARRKIKRIRPRLPRIRPLGTAVAYLSLALSPEFGHWAGHSYVAAVDAL